MYHTPRRLKLQFYDVIFSLVIIRLLGHCGSAVMHGADHMLSKKSQWTQNGTMFVDLD